MLRLAAPALAEATAPLGPDRPRPPLLLAVPEAATNLPFNENAFLQWLSLQTDEGFDLAKSGASFRDRAGGLLALGVAASMIRAGQADFVVAGGVDTYRDLWLLATLDKEQRVKSDANLDGFIPGEGAAFVLLASRRAAERAALRPLAVLAGAAQGSEPGHLYGDAPHRGERLAGVVRTALATCGGPVAPLREVYSSMNGESFWGKEWGVATLRNRQALADDPRIHHPADCYGDVGAAAGPLLAALAAHGIADGYRHAPALVYGSSDRELRAALVLTAG
jgi:3-oxoacyl-[acyl-carrier-protein] synthase I